SPWEKDQKNRRRETKLGYLGLNRAKLPEMIRFQFQHLEDKEGWYRVHPDFSNFYMTLLATRLASRLGLSLVTNSKIADQLAMTFRKGRGSVEVVRGRDFDATGPRRKLPPQLANGMLVDLAIASISIQKDVPAKELLQFRRDHAEELALFRNEI